MTQVEPVVESAASPVRRTGVPLLLVAIDLAGVALGLLWWRLAPVAQVRVQSDGAYYLDPVPQEFITGDLWFALLSIVLGVLSGLIAHRLVRSSSSLPVVLLAVNGALAAVIGWRLGLWLGLVDLRPLRSAAEGTVSSVPLELTALGFLVLFPVAALVAWLLLDLWGDFRRRGDAVPRLSPHAPIWPDAPISPDVPPEPSAPPSA